MDRNSTGSSFLDEEGKVFHRCARERQADCVSGIFHLKLDNPASKELTGSATAIAIEGRSDKLDVAFHATLK